MGINNKNKVARIPTANGRITNSLLRTRFITDYVFETVDEVVSGRGVAYPNTFSQVTVKEDISTYAVIYGTRLNHVNTSNS